MNFQISAGQALEQNRKAEQVWELLISTRSAVEDSMREGRPIIAINPLTALIMVRAALRRDYEALEGMLGDIYREAVK